MRHRLFALFIVLFALAARLGWHGLDAIRQYEDFARPHGQGIAILESIQSGRFGDLPYLYLPSGINLPNPPAVAYLFAALAAIDRSPYVALVLIALLNVLAVAMLFDLGRRLFGPTAGAVAALLMASSPWAIYDLHGTWIQAFLEFACVASAWLVWIAIRRASPRRILIGLALTALFMQTYLLAMALLMQVGAACRQALLMRRSLTRAMLRAIAAGLALCALSAAVYLVALFASNPDVLQDLRAGIDNAPTEIPSLPNPFGLHIDLAGFSHSLRIVSGRDYENAITDPAHPDYAPRDQLNDTRADVVEILVGVGVLIASARVLLWRDVPGAVLLTWFGLPALIVTIALMLAPRLYPEQWYLLITAPAGYLLAGLPFMPFDRARVLKRARGLALRITLTAAGAAAGLIAMTIPITNIAARANTVFEQPIVDDRLESLPERYQFQLGTLWRSQCNEIDNPQTVLWLVSIYGTTRNVRNEASRAVDSSDVWEVKPQGGNCVTRLPGQPPAANADAFPLLLSDGSILTTYRARPVNIDTDFKPLTVNLGWMLLDVQTTPAARPGDTVTVTHAWRIDQLPSEPYADWYFAPFVNLIDPNDQRVLMVDRAPSVLGSAWRAGDYILSTIRFQIPPDAAPGQYKLQLSLFDPNQKKNAVYFAPSVPNQPILMLERDLTISQPHDQIDMGHR